MNDYGKSVLEQYDLEFENVRRGRGCLLAEAGDGKTYRLVEYNSSKVHLELEQEILQYLCQEGSLQVEYCIPNKNGCLYSLNRDQDGYVLRTYIDANECNTASQGELLMAMNALAKFHLLMRSFQGTDVLQKECFVGMPLDHEYERRLRELRRVMAYLGRKKKKNEYERSIEETISAVISEGKEALAALKVSAYGEMYQNCLEKGWICHGRYHYHNVRFTRDQAVITGLEHCCIQVQLVDIYQFMRKVMEKCGWMPAMGQMLLDEYQKVLPLSQEEKSVLACMFAFPEKYWKQVNFYFNTRKSWVSGKSLEKLEKAVRQQSLREAFVRTLFGGENRGQEDVENHVEKQQDCE